MIDISEEDLEATESLGHQIAVMVNMPAWQKLMDELHTDYLEAMERQALLNTSRLTDRQEHQELKSKVVAYRLLQDKINEFLRLGIEAAEVLAEHEEF